jgi:CheY-like chemotaxis protein/anti-sigma regulatory factor (Ser/Thr protein kinase)
MVHLLVVEDSELDRFLVQRLVKSTNDWTADYVSNGRQALQKLKENRYDLILTDVHMPESTGIELLQQVRREQIETPVVVMTARGSEVVAIQALRAGAANYIVKKMLVLELRDVVERVLQADRVVQQESRLLEHLDRTEFSFVLPNESAVLRDAISFLQDTVRHYGRLTESELTLLALGLEEALSNAMIHGNLEVSSDLRELGDGLGYEQLIAARRTEAPYRDRRIALSLVFNQSELKFTITDEGPGFDLKSVPDPTDPDNLCRPCGRGLLLIQSFLDEVSHNAKGNQIAIVKRFRKNSEP